MLVPRPQLLHPVLAAAPAVVAAPAAPTSTDSVEDVAIRAIDLLAVIISQNFKKQT